MTEFLALPEGISEEFSEDAVRCEGESRAEVGSGFES